MIEGSSSEDIIGNPISIGDLVVFLSESYQSTYSDTIHGIKSYGVVVAKDRMAAGFSDVLILNSDESIIKVEACIVTKVPQRGTELRPVQRVQQTPTRTLDDFEEGDTVEFNPDLI